MRARGRAFPHGGKLQLVVRIRIKPPHGRPIEVFRRTTLRLRLKGKRLAVVAAAHTAQADMVEWEGKTDCGTLVIKGQRAVNPPQVYVTWTKIVVLCETSMVGVTGTYVELSEILQDGPVKAEQTPEGVRWETRGQSGTFA